MEKESRTTHERRPRRSPPSSVAGRRIEKPRRKRSGKGLIRAVEHAGSQDDRVPAASQKAPAVRDQTVCGSCGVVFARKTWRRSAARLRTATQHGAVSGVCPACRLVAEGRSFGRVLLEGSYVPGHVEELMRRIHNVAARAEFTQPERRLVEVVMRESMLEVLTTSQKLAHRLARELAKAFQGSVSYHWSDRDGRLLAVWRRDEER